MKFLDAIRALDAEAIPGPWDVYESDDGEWGLIHRRANGMVRPVADFPGSGEGGSSASDASVDLVELLRNSSARIAALVEAAALKRNTRVGIGAEFVGEWVAVPREDFDALRSALSSLDSVAP